MDIIQAYTNTGMDLKKVATTNGGEYAGACPGCGGRDRFRVWPVERSGEGTYWCRRCGKKGDLVQFFVDFARLEYAEAFQAAGRLEQKSGGCQNDNKQKRTINTAGQKRTFEPRTPEPPCMTWQKKASKLIEYAHNQLREFQQGLTSLQNRGIGFNEVERFKLGWIPGEKGKDCIFRSRASWGLPPAYRDDGREKQLWIPRGLVIPYFLDDEFFRLRFRRPSPELKSKDDLKYYVLPGSNMETMIINADKKAFVVVESELDGIMTASETGNAVGVVALGACSNKPAKKAFSLLEQAEKILVAMDYDDAGISAWHWWKSTFDQAEFWPVPEGKDPGEAFQKGVSINDWVKAGLTYKP
mgnify:CR=1 FL=1